MSENIERPVFLRIEASDGEDSLGRRIRSGSAGELVVYPDCSDEGRAAYEAIRRLAVRQLDRNMALLMVVRHGNPDADEPNGMDFDAPNQPTEEQVDYLLDRARDVVDALEILKQLAPWTFDDDDEDEEPEPAPDPAGSETA